MVLVCINTTKHYDTNEIKCNSIMYKLLLDTMTLIQFKDTLYQYIEVLPVHENMTLYMIHCTNTTKHYK